jgi:hypothetical protein
LGIEIVAGHPTPLANAQRRFRRKAENGAIITPMRRFPPPWTIEEHNNACFIVKDATGQALGYFYVEEEPGRRSAANRLRPAAGRRASPSC